MRTAALANGVNWRESAQQAPAQQAHHADTGGGSHEGESEEQRLERRLRESQEVDSRVLQIETEEELLAKLDEAGDNLVVLEVQSDQVCETGLDAPEPELNWRLDVEKEARERMAKCANIKHAFQRTARDCPEVAFLAYTTDATPDSDKLLQRLGVTVLPTLQFYKNHKLLWEHKGVVQMEEGMGEGVMYYDRFGSLAPSKKQVSEITSRDGLNKFIVEAAANDKVLTVLDVSVTSAKGCLKVYPAVLALAKSFEGYAAFGRLLGDASEETQQLMKELRIVEVPTFIFYRGGREVGRHVGSSRGDLIGHILQHQASFGVAPPAPPVTAAPAGRSVKRNVGWRRKA